MRQWRVGTLSLGLVLVGAGAGLLYARISHWGLLEAVVQWWPLVFILLGLEVLALSYTSRDPASPPRLKYDLFSIFIIMVLVCSGLAFQALEVTGLAGRIASRVSAQEYQLELPENRVPLAPGVNRLVIEAPGIPEGLKVYTGGEGQISSWGNLLVRATSQEDARTRAGRGYSLVSRLAGSTQYISLGYPVGEGILDNDCSILVPRNIDVELNNINGPTQLELDEVTNNWLLTGSGTVQVRLPRQADLDLRVRVAPGGEIRGNVPWVFSNRPKLQPGVEYSSTASEEASAKLGNGSHRMEIDLTGGSVVVNQF